jgi:hypothetical protein
MSGLVIVPPMAVTDAILTGTDVTEADHSAWSALTTYAVGDRVISTTTHKIYEALDSGVVSPVTIGNGSGVIPGVVSWEAHGHPAGTPVKFATTGTLPAPLVAGTEYFVHSPFAGGFLVAATVGGTPINTSTAGSGSHSATAASNLNRDPTDEDNQGLYWLEVSATNRWKALDASNSTRTAKATSMYYEFTPAQAVSAVFVGGIVGGTSVRVRMTDAVYGVVFDEETDISPVPGAATWWHWFFGVRTGGSQAVHVDLPTFPNAVIRVDVEGSADLAVGVILLGQAAEFGLGVRLGARVGIQDYSRKEVNEFGDVELVERAYADRLDVVLRLENTQLDALKTYLSAIRAQSVLFVAYDGYAATVVRGFYKTFEILLAQQMHSECSLELEGLT